MTKRIIWRLKEQPTSEMLRGLAKDNILTKDEAREILFNLEEQTDKDIESLKSEIKFLRELVEKLANSQKVVEIIREIEKPWKSYRWWQPYWAWSNAIIDRGYSTSANISDLMPGTSLNFYDIKTF